MSNGPKVLTARERLELWMQQPVPLAKPKSQDVKTKADRADGVMTHEEMVRHNCEVIGLHPKNHSGQVGRRWTVNPTKISDYQELDPGQFSVADRIREAVGLAARAARSDPLGIWGDAPQSAEGLAKRQDETR